MAAAQLEVRLIGDDPDQQRAFDRASNDATTQSAHQSAFLDALDDAEKSAGNAANRKAFADALDDVLGTAKPARGDKPDVGNPEDTAINSIEELIRKIDELISSDRVQGKSKGESTEKESKGASGFFEKLDESINKKLEAFGMEDTRAGRAVSGLSGAVKKYGTKFAGTKVGKSIAGMLGRGASAAGAEAAGTGVASGGAAAGAAGIAAAAGPIAAVGLVAAGAAITFKALTDAVQDAANELTDLSPELAGVRAQYQLTRELARLDRADRIGAGAAQLEAARARIDNSLYEVQTKMLEGILKFGPILDSVLESINVGVRGVDTAVAVGNVIATFITTPTTLDDDKKAFAAAEKSAEALAKAFQKWVTNNGEPEGAIDPFLAEILAVPGNPPPLPKAPRAGGRP